MSPGMKAEGNNNETTNSTKKKKIYHVNSPPPKKKFNSNMDLSQTLEVRRRRRSSPNLFADAAPGVVENGVLIPGHRGVQLLQHDLHAAAAVDEATDVVHHGSLAEHAGALVGGPSWQETHSFYSSATSLMMPFNMSL